VAEPCFLNQLTNDQFEKQIKPEERAAFWARADELGANKGVPHDEVISRMAQEYNMPRRLMAQALDGPKTLRKASDAVRARQKATQQFISKNNQYLAGMDKTGVQRLMGLLNDGTRRTLLFAHGPVTTMIHGLDMAPTNPVLFVRTFLKGFKALSETAHDAMMKDLTEQKYYQQLKDAGMPLGQDSVEGFHKTGWAGRSMDSALGWLRYKSAEGFIDQLRPEQRTPEMMKYIADEYTKATGAIVKGSPEEVNTRGFIRKTLLAPQYVPSKIVKTIVDPIKTIGTFERAIESKLSNGRIQPPSPEERTIAFNRVRRAATWTAVTLSALKLNQAYLQATGSNQKVNLDKPIRGDYMGYKAAGKVYRMRGSMELIALLAKLAAVGNEVTKTGKPKFGQQTPEEVMGKYAEYKLTPGIGLGKEVITGKDVFGRPSAWSSQAGSDKFPRKNWMEEVGQQTPIFMGHAVSAFHEALRDNGVDTRTSMNVIRAITNNPQLAYKAATEAALEGGAEFFGVNIQPDRYIGKDK
jgi:hypothetical protein